MYFCHNITNQTKKTYPEVNNHERIRITKLFSWKKDRHLGWTGNKFYRTNFTFRQRTLSLFISFEVVLQRCSVKKVFLNFAKFTGKHLRQSLFYLQLYIFAKFLRTPFLTEHTRWLLLFLILLYKNRDSYDRSFKFSLF